MIDLVDIGLALKARRATLGLTQLELAQKSGLSRARIEALENGRLAEIGIRNLANALNAVGLDLRLTELNRKRPTLEDLQSEGSVE